MKPARRLVVLLAALLMSVTGVVAAAAPAGAAKAAGGSCVAAIHGTARSGRILGIVRPQVTGQVCAKKTGDPASGSPPLINHGGPVMSVPSVGNQVVVTPIYWAGAGYSFTSSYENVINKFLSDSAAASGRTDNIFSTLSEYSGSNGAITYGMTMGTPIVDTNAFPTAGCTTNTGSVYSDGTGYTTCLDDAQIISETNSVVSSHGLTRDYGHMYVMFLPKHVESCFQAGNPSGQQCTINPSPSAAYCAYHSSFNSGGETVYANMPFPIYQSATGYSCTDEGLGGGIQHPNGDTDADVEVSPTSHEMSEAITDPNGNAWYDSVGYENGDECAYTYGTLSGSPGTYYNQTINGDHYLAQEEFSNADFAADGGGCLQHAFNTAATPTVTAVSPNAGPTTGGKTITITGTNFTGATAVKFAGTAATSFTVASATKITAVTPARAAGVVNVLVTTPGGTSAVSTADRYTYEAAPTITSVSPVAGPTTGGKTVTIVGTGFTAASSVKFTTTAATSFTVVNATKITAVTPAHAAGVTNVRVTTPSGVSAVVTGDRYTYQAAPTITSVTPTSGTAAGGKTVTILGTGFLGASSVKFTTTAATSFTVVSATKITAVTPAHAAGITNIRVATLSGVSAVVTADRYTFT